MLIVSKVRILDRIFVLHYSTFPHHTYVKPFTHMNFVFYSRMFVFFWSQASLERSGMNTPTCSLCMHNDLQKSRSGSNWILIYLCCIEHVWAFTMNVSKLNPMSWSPAGTFFMWEKRSPLSKEFENSLLFSNSAHPHIILHSEGRTSEWSNSEKTLLGDDGDPFSEHYLANVL